MRFLAGFALVLVTVACVQSQLVVPQLNNLSSLLSLAPQLQGFANQLNSILPQLSSVLSFDDIQSLKNKVVQLVLSKIGNIRSIDDIKQLIRPVLEQYLGSSPFTRFDIDSLLQQISEAAVNVLPAFIFGLLGKRDVPSGDARVLDQLVSMTSQNQLNTILTQVKTFLTPEKFQEFQNQLVSTVIAGLGNNWSTSTTGQALQQLITKFLPQISLMRIDWDQVGQSLLNGIAGALPGIAIGLVGFLGKRDLNINIQQLISQLPVDKIAQLIQAGLNVNKADALQQIQKLLQQFFPTFKGRLNFDDFASALLNQLNSLLPLLGQSILTGIVG